MLDLGVCRWDHIVLGISARSHVDVWTHVKQAKSASSDMLICHSLPSRMVCLMTVGRKHGSPRGWPDPQRPGAPTVAALKHHGSWRMVERLLLDGNFCLDNRRIASHTMKCTVLSFAAKRSISLDDRLTLGYHSGGHKMAHGYSRDAPWRWCLE